MSCIACDKACDRCTPIGAYQHMVDKLTAKIVVLMWERKKKQEEEGAV